MKFKVGDKVKLSGFVDFGDDSGFSSVDCTGLVGEVVKADPGCNVGLEYRVKAAYSDGAPSYWLHADQLELVTEAPTNIVDPGVPAILPIRMRLVCEQCGTLHIDKGEFSTKPHHTHQCEECGLVWRPAVEATVGVMFLWPQSKEESPDVLPSALACDVAGHWPSGVLPPRQRV